jgi:hypothetical protein
MNIEHECTGRPEIWGHEYRGWYDGVAVWKCKTCGRMWDRNLHEHASIDTIPHPVNENKTLSDFLKKKVDR